MEAIIAEFATRIPNIFIRYRVLAENFRGKFRLKFCSTSENRVCN